MGNYLFRRKETGRILMQGLDAAGKTSLLYRLKLGEVVTTIPTIGFNVETVEFGGISLTCWDLGGRDKIRPLYRHYYNDTNGFIYVIDSNDRERLEDALYQLVRYVLLEEETKNTVLMVLANKQDIEGCMTSQEVEDALKKKYTFSRESSHTVFVLPCSVKTGEGLDHALKQFAHQLRLKKKGEAVPGLITLDKHAPNDDKSTLKNAQERVKAEAFWKALIKDPITYLKSVFH